jgi:hypothetical protein
MKKGMSGHQSAKMITCEWLTPPEIIKSLGAFDLDPCSPIIRPWNTAKNHFSTVDNGLLLEWVGTVWLNPPYGRQIGEWLNKLSIHNNGIAICFARTETEFFFKYIWEKADSVLFMKGRPHFHTVTGERAKANSGAPVVLAAYGNDNVEAIEESGIPGHHVHLSYTPIIVIGISPSWFSVVKIAVKHFGDDELAQVYEMVERIAPDKVQNNQHWKAKVRQKIQMIRKTKAA